MPGQLAWLAALQPAVVAVVLAAGAGFKIFGRNAGTAARRSALAVMVGTERALPAFRAVGVAELVLAAALLAPPALTVEPVLAAAFFVAMLGYLSSARRVAPESSCGCLAGSTAPIGARTFARAGLLMAACVAAVPAGTGWAGAVADRPVPAAGVLLAEGLAVVALSAELDDRWLLPLRRLRTRLRHPLGATAADAGIPLQATLQQLYRSPAYRSVYERVRSTVLDSWDEGPWRLVTFGARAGHGEPAAIAVFAVPRTAHEPDRVRLVIVDDPEPARSGAR